MVHQSQFYICFAIWCFPCSYCTCDSLNSVVSKFHIVHSLFEYLEKTHLRKEMSLAPTIQI